MSPKRLRGKGRLTLRAPATGEPRAGGRVLELFESPLSTLALRALADGPMRLGDMRKLVGFPAQSTLRARLGRLIAVGAVTKLPGRRMPKSVSYEMTPEGRELLEVVEELEAWLGEAPQGPIALESDVGKAVIKGLAGGWGSAILRALAAQPHSLTELDGMLPDVNYPSIGRRLSTMCATGQIEPVAGHKGKGTFYAVTDWLRRAIAPLAVAGRWERRNLAKKTEPVSWVEVEASFLLALPLVGLPKSTGGECVLAVATGKRDDNGSSVAGVHLVVERGAIVSCETDLSLVESSPTYALASAEAWFDAVIDGGLHGFRIKGDRKLVEQLVGGLRDALFGGR